MALAPNTINFFFPMDKLVRETEACNFTIT